ncbi:hypothetical protein M430DRAFT_250567 [Amorphotheca resinae ATCC 22711]|uniref:Uncharacterized protein n=1 Tax=Amorphotheca resinae ATCC 22711 TaxID=857342 RepID=A0A2T3B0L2_AMORE|nr:hypothetical protein M430DRAFT_250567 [Amorphotheca resinae ATCC 22711]PSS16945.1 hypothetical protein M430DRAFT_250567 [Amorphotheca resinae ATCC 22711]
MIRENSFARANPLQYRPVFSLRKPSVPCLIYRVDTDPSREPKTPCLLAETQCRNLMSPPCVLYSCSASLTSVILSSSSSLPYFALYLLSSLNCSSNPDNMSFIGARNCARSYKVHLPMAKCRVAITAIDA